MKQDGWIGDYKSGMDDDDVVVVVVVQEGCLRQTGLLEWCFPCQCV